MEWYEDGLSFTCQQSGHCCTGEPGYIWVTDEDCKNISTYLEIEYNDFVDNCTYVVNGRRTLKEYENGIFRSPQSVEKFQENTLAIFSPVAAMFPELIPQPKTSKS